MILEYKSIREVEFIDIEAVKVECAIIMVQEIEQSEIHE